jgi:hypothetical protein
MPSLHEALPMISAASAASDRSGRDGRLPKAMQGKYRSHQRAGAEPETRCQAVDFVCEWRDGW